MKSCRPFVLLAVFAASALAAEPAVQITIDPGRQLRTLDPAWFGSSAEYYCAGLVAGLKQPQTVQALKDTGLGFLRWPGGTSALWYFWDAPRQSYSPEWVKHWLSSDDFIAATATLGCASLAQVNTYQIRREGFADFDQAKALVAPGNVGGGAAYAAKWVKTAREKQWGITWWEIGNEDWVYWTGRQHASIATAYATAMRAADPSIKLLAQGMCGTWTSEFVDSHGPVWTEELAQALPPGTVDGLSLHCYASGKLKGQPRALPDEVAGAFARIGESCAEVAALRPMLARHGHRDMQLWITEYNLMQSDAAGPGQLAWWQHVGHGIALADWTGRLLEQGVDRLAVHDLVGHPVFELVDLTHKGSLEDPRLTVPALALQAFTGIHASGMATVELSSNPTRLSGTFDDPEAHQVKSGTYAAVGAWALQLADGGLRVVLVNRDLANAQAVHLSIRGVADTQLVAYRTLGGGVALDATNFAPQKLAWVATSLPWSAARLLDLPAHSLVTIDLPAFTTGAATGAAPGAATMPDPHGPGAVAVAAATSPTWTTSEATRWHQRVAAAGTVTAVPAQQISGERQRISPTKPDAWKAETRLHALTHLSPGALDPTSLEIHLGERLLRVANTGSPEADTADVLLDAVWGGLGLGPSGVLTAADEVVMSYRVSQRRIDGLVRLANGTEELRAGEPAQLTPSMPVLQPGETLLATVFVDYRQDGGTAEVLPVLASAKQAPVATSGPERLPATVAKLRAGQPVRIICWGDSVTAGGDLVPGQPYGEQLAVRMGSVFPAAKVWTIAVGGSNSKQWLREDQPATSPTRFQRIIEAKPDLVIIEFVNDQWMTTAEALAAYSAIIAQLRANGSETLLLTPQRNWERDGSLRASDGRGLVAAYRELGHRGDPGVGVADMAGRWEHLWREGVPFPALLANGFNHPDVRGHRLFYEEVCTALGLQP